MNKRVPTLTFLFALTVALAAHPVHAQSKVSAVCFDHMHEASYAATSSQVLTAVASFESAGCQANLHAAFRPVGVPPKGEPTEMALLALAYVSAKRRAASLVAPSNGGGITARTVGSGGGAIFRLPPELQNQAGGNAIFLPANKLSKEMVLELKKAGALPAQ